LYVITKCHIHTRRSSISAYVSLFPMTHSCNNEAVSNVINKFNDGENFCCFYFTSISRNSFSHCFMNRKRNRETFREKLNITFLCFINGKYTATIVYSIKAIAPSNSNCKRSVNTRNWKLIDWLYSSNWLMRFTCSREKSRELIH
jgi:hypothetical protein